MPKQEEGKWKPYNVDALERTICQVFQKGDIRLLTKATYNFITLNMGFIAHYDLQGFQCDYADLDLFRKSLQTSEYSEDPDYNLRRADRCESDRDFLKWYGEAYCKSEAEGIRRIVAIARNQGEQLSLPIPAWELR
jgi:hypothetical protein